MWDSPIKFTESGIESKLDRAVFEAVQRVGIWVDRDELLRALAYDRGQYEKGFADGLEAAEPKDDGFEIIRELIDALVEENPEKLAVLIRSNNKFFRWYWLWLKEKEGKDDETD